MNPDQNGVYTNTDGTRYYIDGAGNAIGLTYYDPSTGDYAEQGSNIIFDAYGQNTGRTVGAVAKAGTTWLDVINSALNTAGSIFGNKPNNSGTNNGTVYTPYTPPAPVKKNNTVLIIGVVAVVGGAIAFAVYSHNKNKSK